ncbi:hypothetical protein J6590_098162 [Homalodisca vitripennis]|nr:hypothetical protein J6590_098162 [Homalodisca vitripennis]
MFWKIISEISGPSKAIAAFPVQNFASVADSGCGRTVAVSNTFNDFLSQVGLSLASKLPRPVGPPLVDDAVYRIDHVFQLEPLTDSWRGPLCGGGGGVRVPDIGMTSNLTNTFVFDCVANTLYRRLSPVIRELRAVPTLFKGSGCELAVHPQASAPATNDRSVSTSLVVISASSLIRMYVPAIRHGTQEQTYRHTAHNLDNLSSVALKLSEPLERHDSDALRFTFVKHCNRVNAVEFLESVSSSLKIGLTFAVFRSERKTFIRKKNLSGQILLAVA